MAAARLNNRHASFAIQANVTSISSGNSDFEILFCTRDLFIRIFFSGAFEDDDVTHVEGDVNPARDLDIISEELRLKDVEFLNTHLEKLEKLVIRGNDKKLKPEYVSNYISYTQ